MKTTLQKLILENFRDISETFEFNPEKNIWSGPNGCGKTTIADAEKWLREGTDSQGNAKFGIKTIRDGKQLQRTDHSVTGFYLIDDRELELGRVFAERWSKKRNETEETKSGNETAYFVDGIEVKKRQYESAVYVAFGPHYQICSDIRHLAEMDWKKRREILFPLAPDVDQEKVIDSVPNLRELMGKRSIEDAKTAADQRRKKIAKEVEAIPGKIAEHKTKLDNAGGITPQMADKAVSEAETAIGKSQIEISSFNQGDNSETIEQLKKLNAELLKAETEFQDQKNEAFGENQERLVNISQLTGTIKNETENLKEHQEAIQTLRNDYAAIRDRKPGEGHPCVHYGETCPYHGQSVPEEIRTKSADDFNKNKSDALEKNQTRGGEMAAEIKLIKDTIAEREGEKVKLEEVEKSEILEIVTCARVLSITADIEAIKKPEQRAECICSGSSEKGCTCGFDPANSVPSELTQTLDAAKVRLTQAQETRANIKAVDDSQERIQELTAKKFDLSSENDRVQKFLSLYEKFNQAMADAVEGPINAMFENVNFRMFKTLESTEEGGKSKIVPACDILDKEMRPYQGALSNGEQVQAGCDWIRTFQKHYGVSATVFIDNAESITSEIKLDCQYIELKANTQFSNLTKEV